MISRELAYQTQLRVISVGCVVLCRINMAWEENSLSPTEFLNHKNAMTPCLSWRLRLSTQCKRILPFLALNVVPSSGFNVTWAGLLLSTVTCNNHGSVKNSFQKLGLTEKEHETQSREEKVACNDSDQAASHEWCLEEGLCIDDAPSWFIIYNDGGMEVSENITANITHQTFFSNLARF